MLSDVHCECFSNFVKKLTDIELIEGSMIISLGWFMWFKPEDVGSELGLGSSRVVSSSDSDSEKKKMYNLKEMIDVIN